MKVAVVKYNAGNIRSVDYVLKRLGVEAVITADKEELQSVIEELKADNQPYQEELALVKKVQSCADIARRDREMAEADTSGRSEEKMEEQEPEKKTSLLRKLDEKKKECAERDAKQQAAKKKRNHEMSL